MEPVIILGSRVKGLIALLCGIGMTLLGCYLISLGHWWGWVVTLFFSLGIVATVLILLPSATALKINSEGFEVKIGFRKWPLSWAEVESFSVVTISNNKMVSIALSPKCKKWRVARKTAFVIGGAEASIANVFEMKPSELSSLLNKYKQKFAP
ncbi:STM3941 family protein [Vibrio nereis]|uniref:Uncharacterized protein n=1 Tax=Vibrio nereis TaxID=693 RepID=A0A0M0HJD4_VIBNE|nr:STM3941 family protein [Vibrio nereis]KOO01892.1 hypothetical protein AKJ17_18215 [Vibrio nereis]